MRLVQFVARFLLSGRMGGPSLARDSIGYLDEICVFFPGTVFKYPVFKWAAMFTRSTTFEDPGGRVELDVGRRFSNIVASGQ